MTLEVWPGQIDHRQRVRSRTDDTVVVRVKERAGFERKLKSDRTLTLADRSALQQAIIRSGFWRMPDWHGQDGLDGWKWAIEGRRSAISSRRRNAKATFKPPDMDSRERPML